MKKMNEMQMKALDLAACYFANWKACAATHETDDERDYRNRYEGAERMAALMGLEEKDIQDYAYRKWGDEIKKAFKDNNASW